MKKLHYLFHVERYKSKMFFLKTFLIFFLVCVLLSCGINKPRIEIQDFIIMNSGMTIAKSEPLNTFVFENNLNNLPFQDFLTKHFKTNVLHNKSIDFRIEGSNLKLIVYDPDDFERFFGTNNFIAKNQENNANKTGNANKFIALSVISDSNQDCLNQNNLQFQITIDYLKNLKAKYFLSNDRY